MIGSSKNSTENYPRKSFWTQEKETRVKFNPGLSANPSSNNWPQGGNWRRGLRIESTRSCTTNCHARLRAKRIQFLELFFPWTEFLRILPSLALLYVCTVYVSMSVNPIQAFYLRLVVPRSPPSITSKPLILRRPKIDKIMYSPFSTSELNLIP